MRKGRWPYWLKGASILGLFFVPILWMNEALALTFMPVSLLYLLILDLFGFYLVNDLWFISLLRDSGHLLLSKVLIVFVYALIGAAIGWFGGEVVKARIKGAPRGKIAC